MQPRTYGRWIGRGRGLLAVLLALAMVAAACSGEGSSGGDAGSPAAADGTDTDDPGDSGDGGDDAASGEPYRIGFVAPLSGNVAFLGTGFLDMFTARFDKLNAEGGINGHPVELVTEDNQATVERTLSAFRELIDEDVSAIFGPPISSNVEAIASLAEEEQMTTLTIGAFPAILDPPPQHLFQVDATSASEAGMAAEFARDFVGGEDPVKVSLIPIDTPSSFAWRDDIQGRWSDEYDLEVLSATTIPLTAQDLTAEAQAALEGEPDIVLTQALDASMVLLVRKLRELGYEGPVVGYHGGNADGTITELQDPEVYFPKEMRGLTADPGEYPGVAYMQEAVREAGVEETLRTVSTASFGWIATEIVVGVLEECGWPCDKEAFNAAIDDIEIDTGGVTFEPVRFTPEKRQGVDSVVFYHFTDGEITQYTDKRYSTSVYR